MVSQWGQVYNKLVKLIRLRLSVSFWLMRLQLSIRNVDYCLELVRC